MTSRGAIVTQPAPELEPLARSGHAVDAELELRQVFRSLIEAHIRPALRQIDTLGAPQLGPDEQFEAAARGSGLEIYRRDEPEAMRQLYQAWSGVNPRRGLAMIRLYLSMLWPGAGRWRCVQLWQRSDQPYPTALSETGGAGYWLTSRVRVEIQASGMDASDVRNILPALMSVVPAKFVLDLNVQTVVPEAEMVLAAGAAMRGRLLITGTATASRVRSASATPLLAGAATGRARMLLTGVASVNTSSDSSASAGQSGAPDFPEYVPT